MGSLRERLHLQRQATDDEARLTQARARNLPTSQSPTGEAAASAQRNSTPGALSAASLLHIQRTYGNSAVQRTLSDHSSGFDCSCLACRPRTRQTQRSTSAPQSGVQRETQNEVQRCALCGPTEDQVQPMVRRWPWDDDEEEKTDSPAESNNGNTASGYTSGGSTTTEAKDDDSGSGSSSWWPFGGDDKKDEKKDEGGDSGSGSNSWWPFGDDKKDEGGDDDDSGSWWPFGGGDKKDEKDDDDDSGGWWPFDDDKDDEQDPEEEGEEPPFTIEMGSLGTHSLASVTGCETSAGAKPRHRKGSPEKSLSADRSAGAEPSQKRERPVVYNMKVETETAHENQPAQAQPETDTTQYVTWAEDSRLDGSGIGSSVSVKAGGYVDRPWGTTSASFELGNVSVNCTDEVVTVNATIKVQVTWGVWGGNGQDIKNADDPQITENNWEEVARQFEMDGEGKHVGNYYWSSAITSAHELIHVAHIIELVGTKLPAFQSQISAKTVPTPWGWWSDDDKAKMQMRVRSILEKERGDYESAVRKDFDASGEPRAYGAGKASYASLLQGIRTRAKTEKWKGSGEKKP